MKIQKTIVGILVAFIILSFGIAPAQDAPGLAILAFPFGLVTGEVPVRVDLGSEQTPAELRVDGRHACTLTAARPGCIVDLGPDPEAHLIEALRRDERGRVVEHDQRWLNRPGQEAEILIRRLKAHGRQCDLQLDWAHPGKLDPSRIEVALDGERLPVKGDGRKVPFPCLEEGTSGFLALSAIFPDGQRAEAVTIIGGGSTGHTEAQLTAVALVANDAASPECTPSEPWWPEAVSQLERGGFEVVFVLDPDAAYYNLSLTITKHLRRKIDRTLYDAERLWFVVPDERLHRYDGFGGGRPEWFSLLMNLGPAKLEKPPRIADAVAASGLLAGSGPRRRAVILLLGDKPGRDGSLFTPAQAQAYLAKAGVPLFVFRNGRIHDDGWPTGLPTRTLKAMNENLEIVAAELERQCVGWFQTSLPAAAIAATLPETVHLAGATNLPPDSRWLALADVSAAADEAAASEGQDEILKRLGIASGRFDVTAVTVMVSAIDTEGRAVTGLTTADLVVQEDGNPAEVVGLQPVLAAAPTPTFRPEQAGPAPTTPIETPGEPALPVTLFLDRPVSGSFSGGPLLSALAAESARMTALGPVEIVESETTVRPVLAANRDPDRIAQALEELAGTLHSRSEIERHRMQFLRDAFTPPSITPAHKKGQGETAIGASPKELRIKAVAAATLEHSLLLRSLDRLRTWALSRPQSDPRLLVLVGAAFDEDPADFYLPLVGHSLPPEALIMIQDQLRPLRIGPEVTRLSEELAESGWRVVAATTTTATISLADAEIPGETAWRSFMARGVSVRTSSIPARLMTDPLAAQRQLARPSGGEVVVNADGLSDLLDRAAGWYRLTYQVSRPPDGALHELDIQTTRPDLKLTRPQRIVSETSEAQAESRLLALLGGGSLTANLKTSVQAGSVQQGDADRLHGILSLGVDLEPIIGLIDVAGKAVARVSVGVAFPGSKPYLTHQILDVRRQGDGSVWTCDVPMEWSGEEGTVAIVVEELTTGAVGAVVEELPGG